MDDLRDRLFKVELQIKLAKLERNENELSKLTVKKEQIKKEMIEMLKLQKKEGKIK